MREQDARRQAALEKHTAELGDTHWVLDGAVARAMQRRAAELKEKRAAEAAAAAAGAGAQRRFRMEFVSQADLDRLDGGARRGGGEDEGEDDDEDVKEEEEEKRSAKKKTGRQADAKEERGVRHVEEGRIMTASFKRAADKVGGGGGGGDCGDSHFRGTQTADVCARRGRSPKTTTAAAAPPARARRACAPRASRPTRRTATGPAATSGARAAGCQSRSRRAGGDGQQGGGGSGREGVRAVGI
jgi:hypothetical protein